MKKIKNNYTLREVLVKTLGDDEENLLDVQSLSDILTIKEYIPELLFIDNREEIYNNLIKGDIAIMKLSDDAGDTDEVLTEKIEEGEIVVTSSDPESVEVESPKTLISAGTGESVTITIDWEKYNLHTSIEVVAGPLPTSLDISNRDEVTSKVLDGESVVMQLLDDIGTTQEQFLSLVESGEIVVTSSNPDIVAVEGLTLTPSTSPSVPTSLRITNSETFYPAALAANQINYTRYESGYDYINQVVPGRPVELLFADDIGTTQEQFLSLVESGEITLEIVEDTLGVFYLEDNKIYASSSPTITNFDNYIKISATWTEYGLTAEKTYRIAPASFSVVTHETQTLQIGETTSIQFYVGNSSNIVSGLDIKAVIDDGLYVENSLLQGAFSREYTEDGVTLTAVKGIYNSSTGEGVSASSGKVAYNCLYIANTPLVNSIISINISVDDTSLEVKKYTLPLHLFSSDRWAGYSNALDYSLYFQERKPYPINPRPLENGGQLTGSLGLVIDKDSLNSELLEQIEKGITTQIVSLSNSEGVNRQLTTYYDYCGDDMDAVEELFKNQGVNIIPESIVLAWWSQTGTIDYNTYEYIPFTSTQISADTEYAFINGELYNFTFDAISIKNDFTFTTYALDDELISALFDATLISDNHVVKVSNLKLINYNGYPQSVDEDKAIENQMIMLRTFRYNLNTYQENAYDGGQEVTISYDDAADAESKGEYYYLEVLTPITLGYNLDLHIETSDISELDTTGQKTLKVTLVTDKDTIAKLREGRTQINDN